MHKWYAAFHPLTLLVVCAALSFTVSGCGMATKANALPQFPLPTSEGNATLLFGPDIKTAALSLIDHARRECDLTMYELSDPDVLASLASAVRRGVSVRVIVDATVPASVSSAKTLLNEGVLVHVYHVRGGISHIKSLWVDEGAGYAELIGGMNYGAGSWSNNDASVVFRHAGRAFGQLFAHDWNESAGVSSPDVQDSTLIYDRQIKPQLLRLLNRARSTIEVEAFDLTDRDVIQALVQAKQRGVDVRVLLEPTQTYNARSAAELLRAGVKVRDYVPVNREWLHAKIALVDHRNLLLGSANFSYHGFYVNHEGDVEFVNVPHFASAVDQNFEQCWGRADDPPAPRSQSDGSRS